MIIKNVLGIWWVMDRKHLLITRHKDLNKAIEQAIYKHLIFS